MAGSVSRERVRTTALAAVTAMRPQQWYKQGVMGLGILFGGKLFVPEAWLALCGGLVAFTAVASGGYLVNDVLDREADRQHPRKRHRPIASGRLSVGLALSLATVLIGGGLSLARLVDPLLAVVVGAYLGQTLVYSLALKHVAVVDVLVVATGFVLRAVAGVVAVSVPLSPWLVVCVFLLALVLVVGKRTQEAALATTQQRATLDSYAPETLDRLLQWGLAALLVIYAGYALVVAPPGMELTIPLAVYGVVRYRSLLARTDVAAQPEYLLTDPPLLAVLAAWVLLSVVVFYELVGLPGVSL